MRLYKFHNNHTIPGFAFFHVPTIEYLYGINGSNLYGTKNTHVSCGQYNHTLIDTMSEVYYICLYLLYHAFIEVILWLLFVDMIMKMIII